MRILVASVLVLGACGGPKAKKLTHEGSLKFTIEVPSDFKAQPEKSDGQYKIVTMRSDKTHLDILIQWVPGWTYDDMLGKVMGDLERLGKGTVYGSMDLPGGKGTYIHFIAANGLEMAWSVNKCGSETLFCFASLPKDQTGADKEFTIEACKTITCP